MWMSSASDQMTTLPIAAAAIKSPGRTPSSSATSAVGITWRARRPLLASEFSSRATRNPTYSRIATASTIVVRRRLCWITSGRNASLLRSTGHSCRQRLPLPEHRRRKPPREGPLRRENPLLLPVEFLRVEHAGLAQSRQALEGLQPRVSGDGRLCLHGRPAPRASLPQPVAKPLPPGPPLLQRPFRRLLGEVAHGLMPQCLEAGDEQRDQDQRGKQPAGPLGRAEPEEQEHDHDE